jgi:predicted NBD/HSP70 family sugar kinase
MALIGEMVRPAIDKLSERLLFFALAKQRRTSVSRLARELVLPVSTVSNVLGRMLERGLVSRQEIPRGKRGRPEYAYGLRLPNPLVAFHFDGTQLAGSIFTSDLEPLSIETNQLSPLRGKPEAASAVRDLLHQLLGKARMRLSQLDGAAISINAVTIRNKVRSSSVLSWVDEDVEEMFSDQLQLRTRIVGSPLLLAEYQQLDRPVQPQSIACLHVGDGVSGHFITAGNIHRGDSDLAGELGHVIVDPSGPPCGCGRNGCLEALCSGPAIFSRARDQANRSHAPAWLKRLASVNSPRAAIEEIWQAWLAGLPGARDLINQVLDHLAWGLGLLTNLIDPSVVVASGYVLQNKAQWIEQINNRAQPWILHADRRSLSLMAGKATALDYLRIIASHYFHSAARKATPVLEAM